MFPVPLNSWKMSSSIRLPVSISAVPTMVSEPPSSNKRAVAKSFFGMSMALMSTPPDMVRPVLPTHLLKARARRVIESRQQKTSLPISANRRARSTINCDSRTWLSMSRSRLLATTSPGTLRRMSVTSSGRSSMRRMNCLMPGKFLPMAWLMCCRRMVLPVRGGATINARWPLPKGVRRSMTRVVRGAGPVSRRSQDSGLMGVSWSKVLTSG